MLMSLEESILRTITYLQSKNLETSGILIYKTLRDIFGIKRANGSIYKSLERMVKKNWLIIIPIENQSKGKGTKVNQIYKLTHVADKLLSEQHSLWCKFEGIDESALAYADELYIEWQQSVYGKY